MYASDIQKGFVALLQWESVCLSSHSIVWLCVQHTQERQKTRYSCCKKLKTSGVVAQSFKYMPFTRFRSDLTKCLARICLRECPPHADVSGVCHVQPTSEKGQFAMINEYAALEKLFLQWDAMGEQELFFRLTFVTLAPILYRMIVPWASKGTRYHITTKVRMRVRDLMAAAVVERGGLK